MIGLALISVLMGWLYLSFRIWTIDKDWIFGKQVVAFICLWVPYTLAGGNMVLGMAGVCVSQMRKLTNDELIEATVRYQYRPPVPVGSGLQKSNDAESELAVQKFLKENPRCCDVWRVGGVLDFLTGTSIADVEINYELHPELPQSEKNRYYMQVYTVNTCGKVLKHSFGESTETLKDTHHIRK